ncbi:hypothetical protein [Nocardia sp. NPDC003963]
MKIRSNQNDAFHGPNRTFFVPVQAPDSDPWQGALVDAAFWLAGRAAV